MGTLKNAINQAEEFFHAAKYHDSIAGCRKILSGKPRYFPALHLLGRNLGRVGKLDEAIAVLEQARKLRRDKPEFFCDLGWLYLETGQTVKALRSFETSLKLEKDNAGGIEGVAACRIKSGELLQGVQQFLLANDHNPLKSSVYLHLFDALGLMHNSTDALHVAETALQQQILLPMERMELAIGLAITSWMTGQLRNALNALNMSRDIHKEHEEYQVERLRKYHLYLDHLLETRVNNPGLYEGGAEDAIFFAGDSHCLAPSEVIVTYRESDHRILSALITGCKAHHLSEEKENEYKASLLTLFEVVPEGVPLLIGFGEIDCRVEEGFLPAHMDKGIDYQDAVPQSIQNYLQYVKSLGEIKERDLIIYGVPAPSLEIVEQLPTETGELLCRIVQCFNEVLREESIRHGFGFLDVYAATTGENGRSNMEYHLDDTHLHPRIFPVLFESFLTLPKKA